MNETYNIILNKWQVIGAVIFCVSVLGLLYRIGSAIIDQNKWLMQSDEVENIGNH
jgi:hypothetical protein